MGIILACATSGCGQSSGDAVHSQWQDRPALPACGELTLSAVDTLDKAAASGLGCLRKGLRSGRGGELIVHYPSTEGDPLTDYLRATTSGTTEIYTDSTEDENSDKKWSYGQCENPGTHLDFVC